MFFLVYKVFFRIIEIGVNIYKLGDLIQKFGFFFKMGRCGYFEFDQLQVRVEMIEFRF